MSKQIKIEIIKIKIEEKDLELTLEEAYELKDVLGKLFNDNGYVPFYVPPVVINPSNPWPPYPHWTVTTCGNQDGNNDSSTLLLRAKL